MRNKFLFMLICTITIGLSACTKNLEKVLLGTWNITEYKISNGTVTQSAANYGTMTFLENSTGILQITYSGQQSSNTFTWTSSGKKILVLNGDSYTVTTNKPKKQVFEITETTTTGNITSTFTLEK